MQKWFQLYCNEQYTNIKGLLGLCAITLLTDDDDSDAINKLRQLNDCEQRPLLTKTNKTRGHRLATCYCNIIVMETYSFISH